MWSKRGPHPSPQCQSLQPSQGRCPHSQGMRMFDLEAQGISPTARFCIWIIPRVDAALGTLTGPFPKSSGTSPQISLEPSQNCARNLRKWSELTQSCLVALYSLKPMAFCWGNILWRRMSTAFPVLEALEWNTKTIKTSFGDMYPHQQKHLKQPEPPRTPKTFPKPARKPS